jgi:transcription-repair coupling factor (superfamily II helicase)
VAANLPPAYVRRDDLRLEAYRRLAAAATPDAVEDLRLEWTDRFGPLPEPAEHLLTAAHLRVVALAHGITEVSISTGSTFDGPARRATIAPITLRPSRALRLARIEPKARYDERSSTLVVPVRGKGDPLPGLLELLEALLAEDPST